MNDRLEKRRLQCWLDIPNVSVKSSINRYSVRDNYRFTLCIIEDTKGGGIMDKLFVRNRISELCAKKHVSKYKMSLDLGHSKSYIQSISSGKALPSFSEFLCLCDYLGVTPKEFFDADIKEPQLVCKLKEMAKDLAEDDLVTLITLAERLADK